MARTIFVRAIVSPSHARALCQAIRPNLAFFLFALFLTSFAAAQVITIDTRSGNSTISNAPVDHQYQQIQPTHIDLSTEPLGTRDRLELVRMMQAEQGFAMRPLPHGHKGLTLEANGKLEPAGEAYLNLITSSGAAARPGDRVVVTNVRIDKDKIILDLNGGPDAKHRFLRHISIGAGDPTYGDPDTPVVNGPDADPTGSRLTIVFKNHVPDLTAAQLKGLIAPLISFDVKTPVQAFTDTLPKPLKDAILNHEVLVGMSTDMLMFAKGQPETKYHEMEGQMPVDIWLYGKAPEEVTFVRINGNRVIRVEIAKVGQPVQVFTKDVVSAMLTAAGQPTVEQAENVHVIQEGDAVRDPNRQAPAPPPSLRNPGETLPTDNSKNTDGVMKPVQFPKQQPDDHPDAGRARQQQGTAQTASTTGQPGQTAPASTPAQPATSPTGSAQTPQQPAQAQPATIGANPDDQN